MTYKHRIAFSLLLFVFTALSTRTVATEKVPDKPLTLVPLYVPENPEEVRKAIKREAQKQRFETLKKTNIFSKDDIEEADLILKGSPEEAQDIVKYLQDPAYFLEGAEDRYAFFFGGSEANKKATAKAIAYKMTQKSWRCEHFSSSRFIEKNSRKTAVNFRDELKEIENPETPTILILSELNRLLDHNINSADWPASVLWDFLDRQKHNKNFFLIGTLDRVNKVSKRSKSRMIGNIIKFPDSSEQ